MSVAGSVQGSYSLKPLALTAKLRHSTPPILISTNPSHVIPFNLQTLYSLCTHSVHRFPDPVNRPVELNKLRIALLHSDVVVSVFTHPEVVSYFSDRGSGVGGGGNDWLRNWRVTTASNGQLVGFGRAVSDCALTASIHDVMVLPPLRGMGIGQMIIQRIIRVLTSRGIYDISALCSQKERMFFKACGFGDDILESTTMMYTRSVSPGEENQIIHQVGRKQLLVPPDRKPLET